MTKIILKFRSTILCIGATGSAYSKAAHDELKKGDMSFLTYFCDSCPLLKEPVEKEVITALQLPLLFVV